jgi:hypothetical protein
LDVPVSEAFHAFALLTGLIVFEAFLLNFGEFICAGRSTT